MYNDLSQEIQDHVELAAAVGVEKSTILSFIQKKIHEAVKQRGIDAGFLKNSESTTAIFRAVLKNLAAEEAAEIIQIKTLKNQKNKR